MTRPRKEQVSLADTPYYHIVSRCVRRTYLCGADHLTGRSYEHRRQWIEDRIRILSSLFGVDICAYAVMSNHLHLVVKLTPASISALSDREILERWASLFKGPLLVQKWLNGESLGAEQREAVSACINLYRKRLNDLGWFMKCLNEPIARQANKEDGCTGHFWESRYKSQALLTEEAVLSAMAYVDLNPVRAGLAKTPESSQHTSIRERITPSFNLTKAVSEQKELDALNAFHSALKPLLAFDGAARNNHQSGIMFAFEDYLQLIDVTGRCIRSDIKHAIPNHLPPILQRIEIDYETWLRNVTQFESIYHQRFRKKLRQRYRAA